MNTPIFVHVTNNNILECKIIIKSLKIIDPRKDIPLFLDLLPYIIFFYHDSNYTEHNETKMHQSVCEENQSFCKNCILILYCVLLCTSTFKLTPAKYLHVLGLNFILQLVLWKCLGFAWGQSTVPAARGAVSHSGRTCLASGGEFGCHAGHLPSSSLCPTALHPPLC